MKFSEPILAIYIDLDALISRTDLSPTQKYILGKVMSGWEFIDLAEEMDISRQAVFIHFRRAVEKLAQQNRKDHAKWLLEYADSGN